MEMKDVLISAVISVVVAALTGWFTAKQSYRKEIKKTVYEERQKLYIELFSLLEKLQNRPFLIYNYEQFIQPFRLIKARTNLYASRKVLEILIPFNNRVMVFWNKYTELFESEDAEKELQARQDYAKETEGLSAEQIEWEFQQEAEMFMEQNLISEEEFTDMLNNLSTQVRSELKTE